MDTSRISQRKKNLTPPPEFFSKSKPFKPKVSLKKHIANITSISEVSFMDPTDLTLISNIGFGSNSVIYSAHLLKKTIVAVKMILDKNSLYKNNSYKIEIHHNFNGSEIRLIKEMYSHLAFNTHPNIIEILGYTKLNDHYCIIMEWFEGENLRDLCKIACLNKIDLIYIFQDIAKAFEYLHSLNDPWIYRDLKPDNIMYNKKNAKLVDRGSCIRYIDKKLAGNDTNIYYYSPEMIQDYSSFSTASDMFSYGITLAQICNCVFLKRYVSAYENTEKIPSVYSVINMLRHGIKPYIHHSIDNIFLNIIYGCLENRIDRRMTAYQVTVNL